MIRGEGEGEPTYGLIGMPQGTHTHTHVRDRRSEVPVTDLSNKLMILLGAMRPLMQKFRPCKRWRRVFGEDIFQGTRW